jgi:uncharacterized membrane protein
MINGQILIGLLLTILPVSELRGGLPIIVEYCMRNDLSIWPYLLLVLLLNILVILLIFAFFDFLHNTFLKLRLYRRFIGWRLDKLHKKVGHVRKRMDRWGYFALMFFVAIPLPGTGAWAGTTIAWLMGLDRMRSFFAIATGVVIAGLLVLLLSLGFFNGFY